VIDQTVKQLGSVDNPLCSVRGHDTVEIHYGRKGSAHATDWREGALEGLSRDLRWHSAIENDIVALQAEPRGSAPASPFTLMALASYYH
jgi:hypothetical protein